MFFIFAELIHNSQNFFFAFCQQFSVYIQCLIFSLRVHEFCNFRFPHGCQGMVFHVCFAQRHTVYIKDTVFHSPFIDGKSGAQNGVFFTESFQHGIHYRTDIPFFCGVKCGAVFEIQMLCALFFQPGKSSHAICYSTFCFLCSAFQSNDNCLTGRNFPIGFSVEQNGFHTFAHKERGSVTGACEVIGNTADQNILFHIIPPVRFLRQSFSAGE